MNLNPLKFLKGGIDVGDTSKKLINMIDDSKLTVQEKAKLQGTFYSQSINESSIRSKTRRWLSFTITANIFALLWYCIYLLSNGKKELVIEIVNTTKEILTLPAFYMVLLFFYGGYYLKGMVFSAKKKDK